MNKIRIKSTPLFKQVAAVIGEERAQIELTIAYYGYNNKANSLKFNFNECLVDAFWWDETPQGCEFWNSIDNGINPCNN